LEWNDVLGKTPNGSAEIEPSTLYLPLLEKQFFSSECIEHGLQSLAAIHQFVGLSVSLPGLVISYPHET
jgi:hypothetical protein